MIDDQPGTSVGALLHEFNPAQPFTTTRSKTALGHLRSAFTNGHPLAVVNSGWRRGSDQLIERFIAEVSSSVTLLRVPASCAAELTGMKELISAIGFAPRSLTVTDLHNVFVKYLEYQNKHRRRTILILEDSGNGGEWVRNYVTRLVEMDANNKFGLFVILLRRTKFEQLADELPLDALSYRAAKHIALTPFTQAETRRFVPWRLEASDSADIGRIFDFEAISLIHELCEGMPDAVEYLCCASLELADDEDAAPVTTTIVMRASRNLPAPAVSRQPAIEAQINRPPKSDIPTLPMPRGPSIVLSYRGKAIRQISLTERRISIGRATENTLCIDSLYVSRQHATVFKNGAETAIVDLESKNGTYVNARRIRVKTIADQDEITIGYHTIKFYDPHAPRIHSLSSTKQIRPSVSGKLRREPPTGDNEEVIRVRR